MTTREEDDRENDALIAFVEARIAEDERDAQLMARVFPPPWDVNDRGHSATVKADAPHFPIVTSIDQAQVPESDAGRWPGELISHIARHNPARVLADVAAHRAILEELRRQYDDGTSGEGTATRAVLALARVHAAHPDFWPAWAG
jgi:Family of unknown function (DUF6221)